MPPSSSRRRCVERSSREVWPTCRSHHVAAQSSRTRAPLANGQGPPGGAGAMLWPTRLESEVGRTGVNTEMGWIRAEMAHETFYSFLFYPLFSFLYFQVQFEF
jgi:hypothetical protein